MEVFKNIDSKTRTRVFVFTFILIVSLIFFVWKTLISRGEIVFIGIPPYEVQIIGKEKQSCPNRECTIKTSSGYISYLVTKDGYNPQNGTVKVPILSAANVEITFTIEPKASQSPKIEIQKFDMTYRLAHNPNTNNYELLNDNDEVVVYFQRNLLNPQFFDFKNHIIIISESNNYLINKTRKNRILLPNLPTTATNIKLSPNGENIIYQVPSSDNYFFYQLNSAPISLDYNKNNSILEWNSENNIIATKLENSNFQNNFITFELLNIDTNSSTSILTFSELSKLPDLVYPIGDTSIYFEVNGESYRIQY